MALTDAEENPIAHNGIKWQYLLKQRKRFGREVEKESKMEAGG